eukprot:CAMPEP_0180515144 /NCGR_PEP_ID=MMETSP1036_2-20121128/53151_1 /TAXON_ID=632150 /ORGANISM="Azadinium spinosum, Strain 3D9" /LENGTH=56 /DNA_ID=CAMNT_0022526703 /DNA_START=38 /DNA_END=208 /DNA_ORIENTATION=+
MVKISRAPMTARMIAPIEPLSLKGPLSTPLSCSPSPSEAARDTSLRQGAEAVASEC